MSPGSMCRTKAVLALLGICVLGGHALAANEPAKVVKTAANKPADDAAVEEKYQALVAKLPPDEQAWERVLQQNLGSFYLQGDCAILGNLA